MRRAVQCRCLYASLAGCVSCLPRCVRHAFIRCGEEGLTDEEIPLADEFLHYNPVNNAIYMYSKEAEVIKDLDHETLTTYGERVYIYHGSTVGNDQYHHSRSLNSLTVF